MSRRQRRRSVNRRVFGMQSACTAAASAAVALPITNPKVFGAAGASDRLRIGFIGTGNQGMGLLKRILQHDLAEVVVACDVNEGSYGYKNEDHFYGREPAAKMINDHYRRKGINGDRCIAVKEHERVLDRKDVDAVFVVIPDHSHRPIAIEAAESGKHIYCEKPLSLNVVDGKAMVDAVAKHGVVSQTGSHERSNPQSAFVCEAVKEGLVGKLQHIVTKVGFNNKIGPGPGWKAMPVPKTFDYQRWLGTAPVEPYHADRCLYRFRFNYHYSGGQITNFGAHSNDMALWGMDLDDGGPTEVTCRHAHFLPAGSLFTTATETMFDAKFASGVTLRCVSGPEMVQTRFEGTKGWIQTGYKGTSASDESWLAELPEKTDADGRDPQSRHMANFFDCIRTKNETRAPFTRGHNTATLCHLGNVAIKRFQEHGEQTLNWDHDQLRFTNEDAANDLLG